MVIAIRQPSPGAPSRCSTGIRTSSQKTSAVSASPLAITMGRTVTPGSLIETRKAEMPLCLGTLGSVRASSRHQSAYWPPLVHIFWPFTT